MATAGSSLVVAIILVVAAKAQAVEELQLQQDLCPQLERIVKEAVDAEFKTNKQIPAGFLRVFFHDCFSETGCDASILLDEEWTGPINNGTVQNRVRDLVNEIRARVNKECGLEKVSCADILALATRDAVAAANGPRVPIRRGRMDGRRAANAFQELPRPDEAMDTILGKFRRFGLDPVDLVALSGGHTVGRTRFCDIVPPVHQQSCRAKKFQVLDVLSPDVFDNKYFVGLTTGQGIFKSDRDLLAHAATKQLVTRFANSQQAFFDQWSTSMDKLSKIKAPAASGNVEIRRDTCNKPNRRLDDDGGIVIKQVVASA